MDTPNSLLRWIWAGLKHLPARNQTRGNLARQRRFFSEHLEDRTLLSSVTADAFTVVSSGNGTQQSVLHATDWDADAAPEWVAGFDQQRIVQTAGIDQKFVADEWVPVDVGKTYGLSGWARSGDNFGMRFSSLNQQSFGIEEYDADYLKIESIHVLKYGTAADTTLRAALNPGDTQMLLASATGWSTSGDAGTRTLAWYGYTNKSGTTYANYTYTRNVAVGGTSGLWSPGGVNVAARVITLNAPWSGPSIPAGTAMRNATTGADHSTIALNRLPVAGDFSPSEHAAIIGGGTAVNGSFAANRFLPGTAYMRPAILANQHGQTNNFVTWQDVRIQELAANAIAQDAKLPVIDLSINPAENQTVTLPLFTRGDSQYPVGTEARIKVSPYEQYRLSVDSLDYSEEDLQPVGFYSFDADGKLIHSLHVTRYTGAVDTRLARTVQPGNTAIYINDATGWSNAIGGTAESRSLAWYGYRDSSGTLYPDYTYTRNVAFDFLDGLWDVGGIAFDAGVGAWKISLRSAWTGATIAAGTAVRNATGHDDIQRLDIPTDRFYGWNETDNLDWYKYSTVIGGGVWQNGNPAETAFRPGTQFVQPALKAVTPHRYAVQFGPEADQGLNQSVHLPTFADQTLVTLNRSRQWIQSDQLLPVSPSLSTTISVDAAFGTVMNSGQTSAEQHSIGFAPYDADGLPIESLHVTRYSSAVDTTLAATLNPGDTQIVLTNAAGWSNVDVAGTRAISWFGYRDATGTLFPDYSYTRNVAADVVNGLWNLGGISGNVITLRQPWAGPALITGTAVRNAVDADTLIPAVLNQGTLTNSWATLSATISGTWLNGLRSSLALPPGTKSIRIAARANELNFAADDTIRLRNIRMAGSTGATGTLQANNVTVVNLDVLANDAVAASPVQITSASGAKFGTVQILAGAGIGGRDVVRYTSQAWFTGTDQFTYTVRNSSTGETWTTTASVTITADNLANDVSRAASISGQVNNPASHSAPPVSRKPDFPLAYQYGMYDVEAGQTLQVNDLPVLSLKYTATDANNDVMTYRLVRGVSHGVLLLRADGTFEYTPQAGFDGWDSFEYLVTDGLSQFTRTASIHVSAANDKLLSDRMWQISLAFHNFNDVYSRLGFPNGYSNAAYVDGAGNPLLSWRVHLLPFLGYTDLYARFHQDEPWNSANNLPLLSLMPAVFRSPGDQASTTSTRFQTISDLQNLASGDYLLRRESVYGQSNILTFARLFDFTDDWSHSILFLQTGSSAAVPWTAPLDVDHDPVNPFAPLGTLDDSRLNLAMLNGTRISLSPADISPSTFHGLVTISGGELVDAPSLVRQDIELNAGPRLRSVISGLFIGYPHRTRTEQLLRTIGLAMHNYHDVYTRFPAAAYAASNFDANGKPNLSWRVYLLPFLGYSNLFNQFHVNEPWDSPNNLPLLDRMPEILRSFGDASTSNTTRMQVLTGPDALFGRDLVNGHQVGPQIRDFIDGASNTIMVVEVGADRAVPWTAPDDVVFDAANPLAALGTLSDGQIPVLLADGSVMSLGIDLLPRYLPAMASRNGLEVLDAYSLGSLESDRTGKILGGGTGLKNQFKTVGLAMHNYHDVFNRFPVANDWHYFGPDAKPFLSWRVHLLPFFEQASLYYQFHLDEPWDSPHNIQLLDKMPQVYRSRGDASDSTTTRIQVFTGPEALFERVASGNYGGPTFLGPRFQDITDGSSNTFLAIEAGESKAVPWTKPDDLEFDPNDPLGTMGLSPDDVFTFLLADGSVRQISASEVQSVLKALITPAGGEFGGWPYGTPATTPQGTIRPGISITGTSNSQLVITEGKLGAIDVVLDKPGNATIDVALSIAGVVLADKTTLTFTTSNWNIPQAVTFSAIDDNLVDGAELVFVTLSVNDAATTTNEFDALADIVIPVFQVSDDVPTIMPTPTGGISVTEGAAGQTVSVSLSHRPAANVTMSVVVADSSQMTANRSSLVFTTANWNTPQSVVFTAVNDVLADGTVTTNAFFRVIASNDPIFRGLAELLIPASVLDNEVPDIQTAVTNGDTVVSEDGLNDTITVRLGVKPVGNVVINVLPLDSSEVSVSTSQLTFTTANWNVAQTVVVSGVNDALLDGDQLSNVQFSVAPQSSGPYLAALSKTVVVKTIDDEAAELIIDDNGSIPVVSESGTMDTFTVRLSIQPVGNVVVQITPVTPTEVSVPVPILLFTSANWDQPQTVTVVGVDDNVADGYTVTRVTMSIGSGSFFPYRLMPEQTIYVKTLDDEIAAIVVKQTDGSTTVTEEGATDTFNVTLSAKPLTDVTVFVESANPSDAAVSAMILYFTRTNWNQPQQITVSAVDDAVADGNQTTPIHLSALFTFYFGYQSTVVETVDVQTIDNEVPEIVVQQSAGSTVVNESGTMDTFSVALSVKPVGTVVVLVNSANVAEATVSTASLTFTPANWNQPQTVSVTGADDVLADGNQSTAITVSVGATSSAPYLAAVSKIINVTTIDNEVTAMILQPTQGSTVVSETGSTDTFSVALTSKPIGTVTVLLSSGDLSEATISKSSLTFTSTNWNTPQTVTVKGVNDSFVDGDINFLVSLAFASSSAGPYGSAVPQSLQVKTLDDEVAGFSVTETAGTTVVSEGGLSDSVSLRLNAQPVGDVIINVVPKDTTEVSVSKGQLTFTTSNWNVAQTVTVSGVRDFLADGDQNSDVEFSVAPSSSGPYLTAVMQSVKVKTIDTDLAQLVVVETNSTTIVSESGSTDSVSIRLSSKPIGPVTVQLSSSDPSEFRLTPLVLTFTSANWDTDQSVTIIGVNDDIVDGDIVSSLQMLFTPDSAGPYGTAASHSISVRTSDDETAGIMVTETASATVVSESGTTDVINVRLTALPTGDVFINVNSLDTTEVAVSVSQLTFTTSNWNIAQFVTVTGIDDTVIDGDQISSVRFSVDAQSSPSYLAAATTAVNVTTIDDDFGGLIITETDGTTVVTESGLNDTFTVSLSRAPVGNVTLSVSPTASSELAVQNATLTFTSSNWNQPQTVTVLGANESVADGDTVTLLTLSIDAASSAPYRLDRAYSVNVRTIDNEIASIVVQQTFGTTNVSESQSSDVVSISLTSKPTGDVTLFLASSDASEFTVNRTSLTFTSQNWNVAQTVTATGVDDSIVDGTIESLLTISFAPSSAGAYGAAAAEVVSVTTTDNETADFVIVETNGSTIVSESGTTDTVSIMLAAQPTGLVVIKVTPLDATEISVSPMTLTFDSTTWNVARTVTIGGVDDALVDGPQSSIVRFSVDASVSQPEFSSLQHQVVVTTLDDENPRPVIITPTPTTVAQQPVISWTPVADAVQYDIWIQNDSTGQIPVVHTRVSGTIFTPVAAMGIGQYRVWVLAIAADGRRGPWSLPRSFQINTPTVLHQLPVKVDSVQPEISWSTLPGAVRYDLWISNGTTGQSQVIRETSLTSTSFTPSVPLPLGLYYAWVRGFDAGGKSARWSQRIAFYVAAAPQLLSPLNPTFNPRPVFTWSSVSGAVSYEVSYRNKVTRIESRVDSINSTSWTPPADLSKGAWDWWVRAFGVSGIIGLWSTGGTVEIGGRPSLFAIGTTSNRTPLFQWTPTGGATRYILQVDRIDQPQLRVIRNESLTTNQFTPPTNLSAGTYRAWVQAISSTGAVSLWSRPIDFVITQADALGWPSTDLNDLIPDEIMQAIASVRLTQFEGHQDLPVAQADELFDIVFSSTDDSRHIAVQDALLLPASDRTTMPILVPE